MEVAIERMVVVFMVKASLLIQAVALGTMSTIKYQGTRHQYQLQNYWHVDPIQ
jgi:hypothetical protein